MGIEQRHLHVRGPVLSRIVAGCWRWGSSTEVERLIRTALDAGVTSFDHADIYGDYQNQKLFGSLLKKSPAMRSEMQLISKCGIKLLSASHRDTRMKHYDTSRKHILESVDSTLSDLGTDYLDMLLIHRPDPFMDPEEVSEAFGLLKQNGKVLHFGVSNFSPTQFEMLQAYLPFPLVTNQVEFSLNKLDILFDGTLDVLLKHETGAMVYSPLGQGKLVSQHSHLWSKKDQYGATATQLALAWLLCHPANLFPVIGTTRPERIVESAAAAHIKLDRQDWFEMLKIASGTEVP